MKTFERFLKYVMFETMSDESSQTVPSTPGQKVLGQALVDEIKDFGIEDVYMNEKGYVYGSVPSNIEKDVPVIGFIAHVDTADAHPSPKITPRIIEKYDGSVIQLAQDVVLDPAADVNMRNAVGCDIIVTDGTTLLGGDDKAGVAEIVTALEYLAKHQDFKHGRIVFSFTPDEEIGTSQDNFDVEAFGAKFAYTVDGADFGDIEYENFNGASAVIDVKGVTTHPGEAKDKMKNASLIAMEFDAMLPPWERPEHTEDYEGFYHLMHVEGDCERCRLRYIIREHDFDKFEQKKELVKQAAAMLNAKYGEGTVTAEVKDGYRNMSEMVRPHMHLIDFAKDAIAECGFTPRVPAIRGGTDGSELSFKGVPCPNLGTGSFNHHSVSEVANIDHMEKCTEVILRIIGKYAEFEE
ncbi:peptidase T [Ihubacter sp. rT4E-8]|uniref:peptidase T n=1 Tax=unclassified Ihubacter TaxID=2633299 RepID=UPI003C7C4CBE